MKMVHEEATRRNEDEIRNLRKENQKMKKLVLTNQVGRSFAAVAGNKVLTLEMDGESHPNKSLNTTGTVMTSRRHTFIDFIMEAPLPEKWKGFNRDHYDGTTNPNEQMDACTTHMSLYTTDEVVLCRVFATSLKEGALSWFMKLPPNSVDSFETLVAKFDIQFATSRSHHLMFIPLVSIHQEKGESLRKFIDRFGKVTMSIRNLSPDVTMHHMLTALRLGPFADSLCMKSAASLDELKSRFTKFMQLEELHEFRNQAQAEAGGEKKDDKEWEGKSGSGRGDRRRDNCGPRFSRYTPLNADRGKILQEALSTELMPPPIRALSPDNTDRSK